MASYSFRGASGKRYEYLFMDPTTYSRLPLQAGNLLLASGSAFDPVPVFIADVPNVSDGVNDRELWAIAQRDYGAALCFIHVVPDAGVVDRQGETLDLVAAYRPPMNPFQGAE